MNNRLGDLGSPPSWADKSDTPSGGGDDVEMGSTTTTTTNKQTQHMEYFFDDVDKVKNDIDGIESATRKIHYLNEQVLQATTTEAENELSKILRPLIDDTNKRAKSTKQLLSLLKEENKKLQNDNQVTASDLRVRENLCNTLTRKLIDEMKSYQFAYQKYKTDIKNKVKRQVQIIKPDATDEEIDEVMRSEGGRDALYKEQVSAGGINDSVKTTYAKVAGKYQDVLALEQSVTELHQMFLDFALLTEQQGELLDQIEYQVKQAADYVEDGNVEIYEAIVYQKKIRKKQMCIILIIAIVVAVIAYYLTRG